MRKTLNRERIEGRIYDFSNLAEKVTGPGSKNPGTTYIGGSIDIATDDECLNIVTIHYTYITEKTSKGTPDNRYKALKSILDNVADQLLDLLNQLKEEENSFSAMGIDYEEKAFYDILVAVAEKFQFEYPDDKNIELAKEIRAALRDKEKYSDWANSMQIKALMQADIIMILAKHGYPPVPPEIYEKVYSDILEQTENFKKYSDD